MDKKTQKFGNGDSVIINDLGLKNKIIDFLFNSYDLSKYRYNMLTSLQKLDFLKENEHYVTPNFYGYNYLLVFITVDNSKHCVAIEKKGLSYHKNQIDISRINMYKILVNANSVIFNGTIFDSKLISQNKESIAKQTNDDKDGKSEFYNRNNRPRYYMLIKDCYYLMGNQFIDVDMINKMNHLDNTIKTHFGNKACRNFVFKINKLSTYSDLKNLIEKIIPNCGIKNQGLIFYPKYSGINVLYLDKQQEKVEIISKERNHSEIEPKSYDLISNMVDCLKERSYSYEKNGKVRKLWLKITEIPDVYNIFEKNNSDNKLGIAHIPNLKISHMCKSYISESSTKCFECVFNQGFKKWIPINPVV